MNPFRILTVKAILVLGFSVIFAASSDSCFAQSPDSWSPRQPGSHVNRCASIAVNGKIYVFGTDDSGGASTSRVYDPVTDQWTELAPIPTIVASPTVAVVRGLIYVLGGYNPASGTVYIPSPNQIYNPATDSWSTASSPNVARAFATAQAIGNKIYLIGGYPGGNTVLPDTEQFDPATDTWSTMAPMPTSRAAMASAAVGSTIYVIGGLIGIFGGQNVGGTTEAYDASNNTWSTKATMPTARSEFGAALLQGKIYAFGGITKNAYIDTNEAYDPSSDAWVTPSPASLPVTMGGNTGAAVNGLAYSIGINRTDGSAQVNYAYTPIPAATPSSVRLTSSAHPAFVDESILFSAVVSGQGPIPTGFVTFKEGTTVLGTVPLVNGRTSVRTIFSNIDPGAKTQTFMIVASYLGDQNYGPADSKPLEQVVNLSKTSTALVSNLNPPIYGQPIMLTATVTNSKPLPTAFVPAIPTGIVRFRGTGILLGSATLSGGVATITISAPPAGDLAITAAYGGDAAHIASTSLGLKLVVRKAISTTTIASSVNPSNAEQTVTFTATVTSPTNTPVGEVRFMDGNAILGTETLTNGTATFSTATLAVGLHRITAKYDGTANIDRSTSPRLAQRVK